jgi:quercetin dioxygenase-like cupin family protein
VARTGDVIENPATGERIVFRETAAETDGELLRYELFFRPRGLVSREHVHPCQEERHEVVSGVLRASVEGRERTLSMGDVLVVPPGISHRLLSAGEDVHLLLELRPALRSETLLETFAALASEGKIGKRGYPNPLRLALLAREFEQEGYVTWPPLPVQKAAAAVLAPIGRLIGYRASYPQSTGF